MKEKTIRIIAILAGLFMTIGAALVYAKQSIDSVEYDFKVNLPESSNISLSSGTLSNLKNLFIILDVKTMASLPFPFRINVKSVTMLFQNKPYALAEIDRPIKLKREFEDFKVKANVTDPKTAVKAMLLLYGGKEEQFWNMTNYRIKIKFMGLTFNVLV